MSNPNHLLSINEELRKLKDLPEDKRIEFIQELANEREQYILDLLELLVELLGKKLNTKVTYIDRASAKISLTYFFLCYEHIKPSVEEKINKFKMASVMELLIIQEQIFRTEDATLQRRANAIAGMSAAFSLINSMIYHDEDEGFYIDTRNIAVDDRLKTILKNHVLWLETNGLSEDTGMHQMPVFINSQFHELLEVIGGVRIEIN
ncbi:MAG: hypothetical protein P8P74_04400 [Crocinitomicaceae bacterium]|nr:hypothetical protein [Crocinitomicaceae bacterium]